jgi:hypothetical protein
MKKQIKGFNMKKTILALSAFLTTQFATAGVSAITTISDVYVYTDYIVLKVANTHTNDDSCTSSKSTSHLYLDISTEGGQRHYAAALSAKLAETKVRFGYSKCAAWGSTTLPVAYNITIF